MSTKLRSGKNKRLFSFRDLYQRHKIRLGRSDYHLAKLVGRSDSNLKITEIGTERDAYIVFMQTTTPYKKKYNQVLFQVSSSS